MDSLNPQQLEAVTHKDGPLLIIAGAGTGKTKVITQRIAWFVKEGFAKPEEILALTFADKAAIEMQERVDRIMPYGYTQMSISTFHSFCEKILRGSGLEIGLDTGFKLLSATDAIDLFSKNLFKFKLDYYRPLGNPNKFISALLSHFSRLQDEDVNPKQYLDWANNNDEEKEKYLELANVYQEWTELKIKKSYMEFGDVIVQTIKLLRKRPAVLKKLQEKFKYILVDEFQDTNYSQNALVDTLVGKEKNLTVVADDDQCLPPGTKITTVTGIQKIEDIKKGDIVVTAVGKGYLSSSRVNKVMKNKKFTKFVTLVTESGKKVEATFNHKLFCMLPGKRYGKIFYYVYLMQRRNLGWRMGITNDLVQRLKLERSADRIIAVAAFDTEVEARYHETKLSLKYGIPLYPFKPRKRMVLEGTWLTKLFSEIDTEANAQKLATDFGIDLKAHHYSLGGVVRGGSERAKVILKMCARKYGTKFANKRLLISPLVCHRVGLETSSPEIISKLEKQGFAMTKAKNGKSIKRQFSSLSEAGVFAHKLANIVDAIFECKFDVGKRAGVSRSSLVMPISNIQLGMRIPVQKGYEVVYEQVIKRVESNKKTVVYDLEIDRTHNYIANGIVVHNSIYHWRGASFSNVVHFNKTYPMAKLVTLNQNYRSTQEILDRSYDLIQYNNPDRLEVKEKIDKKLKSITVQGEKVEFLHFDRVDSEALGIIQKIQELKVDYKDVAILVRANNHAEPFIKAFEEHGVPYQFLGPGQLFYQPEIKDLISFLKIMVDLYDNTSFYRVLAMPVWQISGQEIVELSSIAKKENTSLFNACTKSESEKIKSTLEIIKKHLDMVTKVSAGKILYSFLKDSKFMTQVLDEKKIVNVTKFFDKIKLFEMTHEEISVRDVLAWIELSVQLGETPLVNSLDWTTNDAVNILTVHSAKGLEFKIVFIVNLVSLRFPSTERKEPIPIPESLIKEELPQGDFHLQEERRLFYVGMTRARERLFLTASDLYGDGKREKKISSFVTECNANSSEFIVHDNQEPKIINSSTNHEPITINYLSYSQIQTFLDCPLHYKAKYLLKIPTPQTASQSFGSSIHLVMKEYYEDHDLDLLKLLKKNWISEGYDTIEHEQLFFKKGEKFLKEYKFDFGNKVLMLEQPFMTPISYNGKFLRIGGKIDRVDELKDGTIEIIDYKTGAHPMTQKEADKNLQLSIYALAANALNMGQEIKLSLYYFDDQTKVTTTRTPEQLEAAIAEIFDVAKQMESSDFKCKGGFYCQNCEFQMLCDIGN